MKPDNNKAFRRCAMLFALLLFFLCVFPSPIEALALDENKIEIPNYDATKNVVQVVYYFKDDNGSNHIIQTGSGILVGAQMVVTTRYASVLSSSSKDKAMKYYTEKFGTQIRFDAPPDEEKDDWTVYAPQLAIVDKVDIFVDASVDVDSASMDVSILKLNGELKNETDLAIIGDSNLAKPGDKLRIVGFGNFKNDMQSFKREELEIFEVECSSNEEEKLVIHGDYDWGCIGGAVVDEYGRVVAIVTYVKGEKDYYTAIPINEVKTYFGKDYLEDVKDYANIDLSTDSDAEVEIYVNKKSLNDALAQAQYTYSQGNDDGVYTEESYEAFVQAYSVAKAYSDMRDDAELSQDSVDRATDDLNKAMNGLVKVEKKSKSGLVIIIIVCVVVALLIAAFVVFMIIRGKRKKVQKAEEMRIKTIDGGRGASGILNSESSGSRNIGLPSAQLYAQFDAKAKGGTGPQIAQNQQTAQNQQGGFPFAEPSTTILQEEEGTTVLNSFVQAPINAYLYRSKTGESIAITSENFRLGKNSEGIEYRIDGNTNVSRYHAVIVRSNENYYIEDLGSTNYTFVNSVRIMPNRKQQLQANDVIYLADEEFIFMING